MESLGGGLGIWLTGVLYDRFDSYQQAFSLILGLVLLGLLLGTQIRSEVRNSRLCDWFANMSKRSDGHGTHTSIVEVTNVSKHGFWLILEERERFLAFDAFPWFREATIDELLNVELAGPGHLRWPALDVDLAVDSIDRPGDYPLVSKAGLAR